MKCLVAFVRSLLLFRLNWINLRDPSRPPPVTRIRWLCQSWTPSTKMPSISSSSICTSRASTFSIGDSPEIASLRIQSFINSWWKIDPKVEALGQSLYIPDLGPNEQLKYPIVNDAVAFRLNGECFSSQLGSSASSFRFSFLSFQEDVFLDYLGPEAPSLDTAKLQSHKSVPVPRLVHTPNPHVSPSFRKSASPALTSHPWKGPNEWTRPSSALLDFTCNGNHHEYLSSALLSHETSLSCVAPTSESPAAGCVGGHSFLSPPRELSSQVSYWRHEMLERHSAYGKIVQTSVHQSRRTGEWSAKTTTPEAFRTQSVVPVRTSSLQATQTINRKGGLEQEDCFKVRASKGITEDHFVKNRVSSSPSVLFHLPFTPSSPTSTESTATDALHADNQSLFEAHPSSASPISVADTLVADNFRTGSPRLCKTLRPVVGREGGASKSRLRRWWAKFHSGHRCWRC